MGTPAAPAQPDYSQANAQGIYADASTLAARNQINQAAELGTKGSAVINGVNTPYDFTGLGSADLANAQTKNALDLLNQYGSDFVDKQTQLTAEADPTRAGLNTDYEKTVQADLDRGGTLDPSIRREVEQNARGGAAARGNILGDASAYTEAMQTGLAAQQTKQQGLANAQATLGLAPVSSQFGAVNQATAPIAAASTISAGQLNPNAGQEGAQFAAGNYGTASQNWANPPTNPWMVLGGTAIGAAASAARYM